MMPWARPAAVPDSIDDQSRTQDPIETGQHALTLPATASTASSLSVGSTMSQPISESCATIAEGCLTTW